MHCPTCHKKAVVKNTYDDGSQVMRLHWCPRCDQKFTTVESYQDIPFKRPKQSIKSPYKHR